MALVAVVVERQAAVHGLQRELLLPVPWWGNLQATLEPVRPYQSLQALWRPSVLVLRPFDFAGIAWTLLTLLIRRRGI